MVILIMFILVFGMIQFSEWQTKYNYEKLEKQGKLFFQKELEGIEKIYTSSGSNYMSPFSGLKNIEAKTDSMGIYFVGEINHEN